MRSIWDCPEGRKAAREADRIFWEACIKAGIVTR
jgi:hypothetical protein